MCICVSSPTNRLLHDFFRFGFFVGLLLLPLTRSLWFLLFPLNIRLPIEHRIRINLMLLMQTCELYWYWPFIRIHMLFSSTFCCCYCRCCFLPLGLEHTFHGKYFLLCVLSSVDFLQSIVRFFRSVIFCSPILLLLLLLCICTLYVCCSFIFVIDRMSLSMLPSLTKLSSSHSSSSLLRIDRRAT